MEKRFAKICSAIFHPLLIPTYSYIILLNLKTYFSLIIPEPAKWKIVIMIFIITFLIPLFFTFILFKWGMVKSFYMENREERTFPFIIATIFFFLAYYLLKNLQIAPVYYYFMTGATFLLIITILINLFWKISSHMIGIGAVLGAVSGLSFLLMIDLKLLIISIILISGLLAYSRLKLNAHSPAQVYTGFILGVTVMYGLILLK